MNHLVFIEKLLGQAAKVAKNNFDKVGKKIQIKEKGQLLTETDKKIGKMYTVAIKRYFPSHNIIDEEEGVVDNNSQFTWLTDPIDGTANFAHGVKTYGSMIGLLKEDRPIAAGVVLPEFKEIYLAEKDKGVKLNGKKIVISDSEGLSTSLVAYSINPNVKKPEQTKEECDLVNKLLFQFGAVRMIDNVYETTMVIKRKYAARMCRTSKIWDNVAPQLLTEEAGGIYTDFFGKPMDYSKPLTKAKLNFTFCSGTLKAHQAIQKIIHNK